MLGIGPNILVIHLFAFLEHLLVFPQNTNISSKAS